MAMNTLRPITKEQVERVWKSGWKEIDPYKHYPYPGGVVERQRCGMEIDGCYENYNFCPRCGGTLTDKDIEVIVERIEKLNETT